MNIDKKMEERSQQIYDELWEYIENAPYEINDAVDAERLTEIANAIAEGEVDEYFDNKYTEMKEQ